MQHYNHYRQLHLHCAGHHSSASPYKAYTCYFHDSPPAYRAIHNHTAGRNRKRLRIKLVTNLVWLDFGVAGLIHHPFSSIRIDTIQRRITAIVVVVVVNKVVRIIVLRNVHRRINTLIDIKAIYRRDTANHCSKYWLSQRSFALTITTSLSMSYLPSPPVIFGNCKYGATMPGV